MDLDHVLQFSPRLGTFAPRLGDLDEANFDGKLNHVSQFFRLRRRLPRVPLTSRGGPLGARASSGLAALAAVRLRRTISEIDR